MIAFSCGLVVASTDRINGPEKGHLSILEGRVGIKGSNLVIGCVAATLSLVGGRGGVWGVLTAHGQLRQQAWLESLNGVVAYSFAASSVSEEEVTDCLWLFLSFAHWFVFTILDFYLQKDRRCFLIYVCIFPNTLGMVL